MKHAILFLMLCMFFCTLQAKENLSKTDKEAIKAVMKKQEMSWNSGNIEQFMETYWNSPELVFVGGNGPVYGWKQTLERYKKSYPTQEKMGKLTFDLLKIRSIDTRTAFLIGKFHLSRSIGDLIGHFTLVLQKIDGNWLIVSDHSSSVSN